MITIRTMVPTPINMGFLSDARRLLRDGAVYLAGQTLGALAVCPGPRCGPRPGGRGRYFLKTSLIFSKACLRLPLA